VATNRNRTDGFTVLEVLIAMAILFVGLAGLLKLMSLGIKATAVSRHGVEASVLAEDRMEKLRTGPITSSTGGSEVIDDDGHVVSTGAYTRTWSTSILPGGTVALLTVSVNWKEAGAPTPYVVTLVTERLL
jgi:Tfp pilus assembly protein PilV